jgi:Uma2 family endonuclease
MSPVGKPPARSLGVDPSSEFMATVPSKQVSRLPRIGPRSAGVPMTPAEFDAVPASQWDDRFRYELINGVLIVTPPVGDAEVDPNEELGHWLRTYRDTHPQGSALDSTMPERTVPTTSQRRRCDRAIWTGLGRLPDTKKDVPTIAVEFVPSRRRDVLRDYETKRDEYLAAGVREYWVIDRFRRIMTVYRKGIAGPTHEVVAEAQTYQTRLLPGFELPLARLLSRADQWKKTRPQRPRKPPAGGTNG